MKQKIHLLIFISLLFGILTSFQINAQNNQIAIGTFPCGSGILQDDSFILASTAGQPIIGGAMSNTTLINETGFWYQVIDNNTMPAISRTFVTNVSKTSATVNGDIIPNGIFTTVKFEWGIDEQYGNVDSVKLDSIFNITEIHHVSKSVKGLTPATTYKYRLVASNYAGENEGKNHNFITYADEYLLDDTTHFASHDNLTEYKSNEYRIIALPGLTDFETVGFVANDHKKDWQIYWDNGQENNIPEDYLKEFDQNDSDFRFQPGRAFWLLHKGDWIIDKLKVKTTPLNASNEAEIELHPGWNMIGNPFDRRIPWSAIKDTNNVNEPIWTYFGSHNHSSRYLEPFIGYQFYNGTNLSVLRIPYHLIFSELSELNKVDPAFWRIHVSLTSDNIQDQSTTLGIAENADERIDGLDYHKPRSTSTTPVVFFNNIDNDGNNRAFATDIKPTIDDLETWDLFVQVSPNSSSKLSFSGIESVPSQFKVNLIAHSYFAVIDLRNDSLYNFTPATNTLKFTLAIGTDKAIQKKLKELIPKEFMLGNNYPNPFNLTTKIPISIPMNSDIKLQVYNSLGQIITTIFSGRLQAGHYLFEWNGFADDGRKAASGVYFYQLTANKDRSLKGKMVLMK